MPFPKKVRPLANSMIVAPQPEAVETGTSILGSGGNAVDAVIAAAITQGIVDPLMCGIGGLGILHIHNSTTKEDIIFDGLSRCPLNVKPDMWEAIFKRECSDGYGYEIEGAYNEYGHKSVTTPGILKLMHEAHNKYGKLKWKALFDPAIAVALDGWLIRPHVAGMMALDERHVGRVPFIEKLRLTHDGRFLYLRPDGTLKKVGDQVENPDLAKSLQSIADNGIDEFYSGKLADAIIDDMHQHGGFLSSDDLKSYKPQICKPIKMQYRGYTISVPPPPSGGLNILQMLKIIEKFDLIKLGHNSPEYIATLSETMKWAGSDRDRYIGDPDFQPIPDHLLSEDYNADISNSILKGYKKDYQRIGLDSKDTTTISCVDENGLIVSLTHTLGVPSGVIPPKTGFMLNGAMNWYDPRPGRAGSIYPGKRRYSSMSPLMVFDGDRCVLTLGAPGGAWIGIALMQVIINVLDWGMGIQDAIMAPRFSATSNVIDIGNRIPYAVEKSLSAKGYTVARSGLTYPFAAPHGISLWDGLLAGGIDPQRDGYVGAIFQ